MSDGFNHVNVRLIDDRWSWSDAAALASLMRECLAGAYSAESFDNQLMAVQVFPSHFIQGSIHTPINSTALQVIGNWRSYIPDNVVRVMAEILLYGDFDGDVVGSAVMAVDGVDGSTIDTEIDSGNGQFVRIRTYWKPAEHGSVTLENDLDIGLKYALTANAKTQGVPTTPIAVTIWTEVN